MIVKSVVVCCDGDERLLCDEEIVTEGREATIAQARAEAGRQGWSHSRGLDLCPEHRGQS